MKKWLGSAAVIVILAVIALRTTVTWNYIGQAIQPVGGQSASIDLPAADEPGAAEVTMVRLSGRWRLRDSSPRVPEHLLTLNMPNGFERAPSRDGKVIPGSGVDLGTWSVDDGRLYLTSNGRIWNLGRVTVLTSKWFRVNGENGCLAYERAE